MQDFISFMDQIVKDCFMWHRFCPMGSGSCFSFSVFILGRRGNRGELVTELAKMKQKLTDSHPWGLKYSSYLRGTEEITAIWDSPSDLNLSLLFLPSIPRGNSCECELCPFQRGTFPKVLAVDMSLLEQPLWGASSYNQPQIQVQMRATARRSQGASSRLRHMLN